MILPFTPIAFHIRVRKGHLPSKFRRFRFDHDLKSGFIYLQTPLVDLQIHSTGISWRHVLKEIIDL